MSRSPKPAKVRLTVTVDAELAATANAAVQAGEADSVSGWVNDALLAKADTARKLAALAEAVAAFEAEFGVITAEDMAEQERADRRAAEAVREAYRARSEPRAG